MAQRKYDPENQIDSEMRRLLKTVAKRFTTHPGGYNWFVIRRYLRRLVIDECLLANRGKITPSAKMMRLNPQNFNWYIKW